MTYSVLSHDFDKQIYERNREKMLKIFIDGQSTDASRKLGVELERIVVNPSDGSTVGYEGTSGVLNLLRALEKVAISSEQVNNLKAIMIDGHLAGYNLDYSVSGEKIGLALSLEPAAQLELAVGPSLSLDALAKGFELGDELLKAAARSEGFAITLCPHGVNGAVEKPEELKLIPKRRYELMDQYLSKTGIYARDMMRLSTSTQVSIDYRNEEESARMIQLGMSLAPLISFICESSQAWRGKQHPRMARAQIWGQMDPERCQTIPGVMKASFGWEDYIDYLEAVHPILMTDAEGRTVSTGELRTKDILGSRDLSRSEIEHLMSMVFPDVRLKGFVEIRPADSLLPQHAISYAACIKALFYHDQAFDKALELFVDGRSEGDIQKAREALISEGWSAQVYGSSASKLVEKLVDLIELDSSKDVQLWSKSLCSLWTSQLRPCDLDEYKALRNG